MPYLHDWFSNNIPRWNRHVKPFLSKRKNANILMIGINEGRAPLWLKENNMLKGDKSKILCIDAFGKGQIYENFLKNVAPYEGVIEHRNVINLRDGIYEVINAKKKFDFIFIDSIDSQKVLESLVLTFPLLKPKGLLIIDDYTNNKEHSNICPKAAIDSFMDIYASQIKALELSWQAILLKRSRPLKRLSCKSEYYHENLKNI